MVRLRLRQLAVPQPPVLSFHIPSPLVTTKILVVTMGSNNSVDNSATYDVITMTQGVTKGFGDEEAYGYWYLVNPPQGTHDVVITFPSNTNYRQYAAVTFQNVDQTTPFDTDTHVGGNGGKAR
jgi:hypothetical protein